MITAKPCHEADSGHREAFGSLITAQVVARGLLRVTPSGVAQLRLSAPPQSAAPPSVNSVVVLAWHFETLLCAASIAGLQEAFFLDDTSQESEEGSLPIYRKCVSHNIIISSFISLSSTSLSVAKSAAVKRHSKVLSVGEELWRETLPLHSGSRLYQLQGLKSHTWYEVKLSYPASIPASFSLELRRDKSDVGLHMNRRLLNTEKIIFNTENLAQINQDGMYVLVTVEPEGFVAIPNVSEREFMVYNIVCDELVLGIPHKAWGVAILVMLCLGFAFTVPSFLPPDLLQKSHSSQTFGQSSSKYS